jgi:hypothetical protein
LAIKVEVLRADLQFEAGYPEPDFGLFRDESTILHDLFKRLEPHGLRLSDVRVERGSSNVGEQQILCHLFNYWMTVKLHIEKIEVVCTQLPRDHVEKFNAAILDVLRAVKDYRADLAFKAFAVGVGLHAKLEGQPGRDYLARFAANVPQKLGPSTGNGAVFYFGPEGDRMLSSVTADVSAVVQDAVWLRIHGVWDARKVTPDSLPGIASGFVRAALESLGLQLSV